MRAFLCGFLCGSVVVVYLLAVIFRLFFADIDPQYKRWGQVFKPWSK